MGQLHCRYRRDTTERANAGVPGMGRGLRPGARDRAPPLPQPWAAILVAGGAFSACGKGPWLPDRQGWRRGGGMTRTATVKALYSDLYPFHVIFHVAIGADVKDNNAVAHKEAYDGPARQILCFAAAPPTTGQGVSLADLAEEARTWLMSGQYPSPQRLAHWRRFCLPAKIPAPGTRATPPTG